jgi:hypothetical protein
MPRPPEADRGELHCPPPEVIKLEISRSLRGHFNLIHHKTGFRADVYAAGKDELNLWIRSISRS